MYLYDLLRRQCDIIKIDDATLKIIPMHVVIIAMTALPNNNGIIFFHMIHHCNCNILEYIAVDERDNINMHSTTQHDAYPTYLMDTRQHKMNATTMNTLHPIISVTNYYTSFTSSTKLDDQSNNQVKS